MKVQKPTRPLSAWGAAKKLVRQGPNYTADAKGTGPKAPNPTKEPKGAKEPKESKPAKEPKEPKESKESKESKPAKKRPSGIRARISDRDHELLKQHANDMITLLGAIETDDHKVAQEVYPRIRRLGTQAKRIKECARKARAPVRE